MDHPDPSTKWKNMRRMAWLSLFASLTYPVLVYTASDSKGLVDMAMPFYLFTGSVLGAYMGFSTWGDKK
jgi:hypothetical protein